MCVKLFIKQLLEMTENLELLEYLLSVQQSVTR